MKLRALALLSLAISLAILPIAAANVPRSESKAYMVRVPLGGGVGGGCHDTPLTDLNYYMTQRCFLRDGSESFADVAITDQVNAKVSGAYAFISADGFIMSSGNFCGSISHLSVPAGSIGLDVALWGGVDVLVTNPSCGFGTAGTMTVTWT